MKLGIILTATVEVAVKGGNFTSQERYRMYADTLRVYADLFGKKHPIIFVENSEADLCGYINEFSESLDLEIVQFKPSDAERFKGFDALKGKGYNEYLMITKAMRYSQNILDGTVTHFLKITGRYAMTNINTILKEVVRKFEDGIELQIDIKDSKIYDYMGLSSDIRDIRGDSRFFATSVRYYKENLEDLYAYMNDYDLKKIAEYIWAQYSRQHRGASEISHRFKTQARFNGFSGCFSIEQIQNGIGRHDNFKAKMKDDFRQIMRWLCPWIWL